MGAAGGGFVVKMLQELSTHGCCWGVQGWKCRGAEHPWVLFGDGDVEGLSTPWVLPGGLSSKARHPGIPCRVGSGMGMQRG